MLVLSRRKAEVIKIGDDIEVVVQRIRGNRVVLGIRAPQSTSVQRGEVEREEQEPEVE